MRLSAPFLTLLSALTTATATALPDPPRAPTGVCSTTFHGSAKNLEAAQQAAFASFADLFLVQKDIQTAFDRYIPGEYINHNPSATSGRAAALAVLVPFLANPDLEYTVKGVFAGQGFGMLHYRMKLEGVFDFVVMDRYRFVGTCIVEHWDVAQSITGRETNPVAFF